ncbi:MAG: hypothetical protein WA364_00610 [Candidatus Nitrosopolaris sp.]
MIAKRTGLSRGSVTNILKAWCEQSKGIASPEIAAIPDTPHEIAQASPASPEDRTRMRPPVREPEHSLEAQAESPEVQEESFMMDWVATRLFEIKNEKRRLREAKDELGAREVRLLEIENNYRDVLSLLPMAKQLQDKGIDFDLFLPWKEAIYECAVTEKIDLRTAAYRVTEELKLHRQFGGLQKSIQQAQQRLVALSMLMM